MKKKILIVEDDPFTQQFYAFLFNKTDHEILITENIDDILMYLDNKEINLIIMDINLKNTTLNNKHTNGIEIAQYLKENEKYSHIPIIVITAYENKISNNMLFDKTLFDDYLVKPINDFNFLLDKINRLVNK